MAGRSSTSLKKRQKEMARQDKQKEKEAKREQRSKIEKTPGGPPIDFEARLELEAMLRDDPE